MKFTKVNDNYLETIETWLPELGNFYDGHKDSKFFEQITNKDTNDPYGYFTQKKELWSATEKNELLGFVCLNSKRGGSIKIGPIMVSPNHRGKGVGKFLINHSILRGKEMSARKLYATTSSLNIPAGRLFESLGFTKEASLPNQYKQGAEKFIWGLFLNTVQNAQKPSGSLVKNGNEKSHSVRGYEDATDRTVLEDAVHTITEWHTDLDQGFIEGIVNATKRNLDYETKGKEIFISEANGKQTGVAVTTPKRGGPVKVYPLTGSESSQTNLIEAIKSFYSQRGYKKLYTFIPETDKAHLQLLTNLGFTERGILESPYKDGYNLAILDIQI